MEKMWGFLAYSSAIHSCFCTVHFLITFSEVLFGCKQILKTLETSVAASQNHQTNVLYLIACKFVIHLYIYTLDAVHTMHLYILYVSCQNNMKQNHMKRSCIKRSCVKRSCVWFLFVGMRISMKSVQMVNYGR